MKVLFVCRGNHGRSQMAEAIFNKLAKEKHVVASAGTKVISKDRNKEGIKVSDPNVIDAMKEIGIDVTENIRNQVTPEMLEKADRVVIMAEPETFPEFLKIGGKVEYWEIPDPFEQSLEFTKGVRDQLKNKITSYLDNLS